MSRARDLSQLISDDHLSLDSNNVGIGTTIPTAKLNVAGIVSATQFYGDGSNLDGVASAGLGTALAEGDDNPLSVIYYTDNVLSIGATITVDTPTSTNTAYTQYAEVAVGDGADLIVADGDDFVPDILGIGTDAVKELPGTTGGRIRADYFTNHAGTGKPTFQTGLNITGQCIADFFVGPLSGNAATATSATSATSADTATNASGLTGTPDITVGSVSGTSGNFSGNVSIGGTLTYEDVTNVDSVGVVTARGGLTTQKMLKEQIKFVAGKLSDNTNIDLENGMVHHFSLTETTSSTPNIRFNSSESLNSVMSDGEAVTVILIVSAASAGYFNNVNCGASSVSIYWLGGSGPSSGGSGSKDIYSLNIIKNASDSFIIYANQSNF